MATQAQIKRIQMKLEKAHPDKLFRYFSDMQNGIGAVLCLLDDAERAVTAGDISAKLGISTARVAVLLRKMAAKGLVLKERSPDDARITVVHLTKPGKTAVRRMKGQMDAQMANLIETLGEERLLEYIRTAEEIQKIASPPRFDFGGEVYAEREIS